MEKKTFTIYYEGKPIFTGVVEDLEPKDYIERKEESKKNLVELVGSLTTQLNDLKSKIENHERDIKVLKGEE